MNLPAPPFSDLPLQDLGCFPRTCGGRSRGLTFLCLHGLGDCGRTFEGLSTSMRLQGFHFLSPDLPGYGESPRPAKSLSLAETARKVSAALLEGAGTPIVLLGHSMGGTLAQLIAEAQPPCVRAVVNVEGNVCLNDCAWSGPVASASLASFVATGFRELQDQVERAGTGDAGMARYADSLRLSDPAIFHRHATDLVALSRPSDLARRLSALSVPALYIAGSPGGIGPRSLDLLREAGVNTKILSPAGHCPHLDQPDAFAQAISEFLEDVGIARRPTQ